jgi:hypothetical protein
LVEYSTLRRIGDADLCGSWPVVVASPAVGQVSSGLCPLPELFAFPYRPIDMRHTLLFLALSRLLPEFPYCIFFRAGESAIISDEVLQERQAD